MTLDYSFNGIDQKWIDGDLPFPNSVERVKVNLPGGRSASQFPPFHPIGELLIYQRPSPKQFAVTLLLTYHHGTQPLTNTPQPMGVWVPVPGSPIFGQIRIALTHEAVNQIRQVNAADAVYELTLENVELVNMTPQGKP